MNSPRLARTKHLSAANVAGVSVAVVIVNYRTPELTGTCLSSLAPERAILPKLKVVVVDGGSADGSAEKLARTVTKPEFAGWVSFLPLELNGGFGWANNQAILALARAPATPDFVHLLNPDAEITSGAVALLVEALVNDPRCGAAGSQLVDEHGAPAASAFRFPSAAREFVDAAQSASLGRVLGIAPAVIDASSNCEVDWVTGASVMVRSAALRETGLFDDGFFLYFEEVELMHRLRARGWTVRHVPESRVIHREGSSTGIADARKLPSYWYESRRRYFALTGGRFAALAADLGSLAGIATSKAKLLMGRRGGRRAPRGRDLLRLGVSASAAAPSPSVPAWGDPPGKPPAWMSRP